MKNIRYTVMLFSLMLLVVLSVSLSAPVLADDTSSYYYDYINVDINVLQNGDMEITEIQKLDYKSGDFHYAYRWIPADRVEDITAVSVSEQGTDYQPNSSVEDWIKERQESGGNPGGNNSVYDVWLLNGDYWIGWWFPETRNMDRIFTIKYTVHGGLRINEQGGQVFWKAIFGGRDTYINQTTVLVHLPPSVPSDRLEIHSYGANAESRITDKNTVEFTTEYMEPDQELEVQVIFPHGLINAQPPAWQQKAESMEIYNRDIKPWINLLVLFLSIVVVPVSGFIWIRKTLNLTKVEVSREMVPVTISEPPDDLPPAVVNLLMGGRIAGTSIIATIFDLARRGVLTIEEIQSKGFLGRARDLLIRTVKDGEQNLYETALTDTIASPEGELLSGNKTRLSALSTEFNKYVEQDAMDRGLFIEKPSQSIKRLVIPGIIIAFGSLFIGITAMIFLFEFVELLFLLVLMLFTLGLVAAGFSVKMRMYTHKGAVAAANWKAFSLYMKQVMKSNIIAEDTAGLWDSYLSYAVVFGITNPWIKRFIQADVPAPVWFYAWSSYGPSSSSATMSQISNTSLSAVANAFTSMASTVSSTFSGGSGTGGAGGGGGGGGGGGSG